MAEYINRQEAKEWIADWLIEDKSWHPYSKGKNIPTVEVFDIISRIPAADVQPVKHGQWILDYGGVPWNVIECSECGEKWHHWQGYAMPNFCSNCGADMRETNDEKA